MSCGSSSSELRRSPPDGRHARVVDDLEHAVDLALLEQLRSSSSSAPSYIVRNFSISNRWPPRPTRGWRKRTRPGDETRIAIAMPSISGVIKARPTVASPTSNVRFTYHEVFGSP